MNILANGIGIQASGSVIKLEKLLKEYIAKKFHLFVTNSIVMKNSVIIISPNEKYTNAVYEKHICKYELFNKNSLVSIFMSIINLKESFSNKILSIKEDLLQSKKSKYSNVFDIFNEVINVQNRK